MHQQTRKKSLFKTLDYLEALHSEFVEEIEKKTAEIHIHKAMKSQFRIQGPEGGDVRKHLQVWRKKSYALHRRRTMLKSMKECLERQIYDLQTALNRLNTSQENTRPLPMDRLRGQLIRFKAHEGFPLGLSYDAR